MAGTVNYRETLVTYLRTETLEKAAQELGISVHTLKSRIATMRSKGVNIPRQPRQVLGELEVAQLNSIIKKYVKETK